MVSKELQTELGQILQDDFGLNLQDKEVAEIGDSLVQLFDVMSSIEYEYEKNEKTSQSKR